MTNDETISLRATVIAGKRYDDDWTVIWRGMSIGSTCRPAACQPILRSGRKCSVQGKPGASANGSGTDLDDCKAKFKTAWAAIRAELTEVDIASAREYAENSREALARYDRKQRR